METLKPVEVSEFYIDRVSAGMRKYFWENIFAQIFEILADKNVVINSKDDVIAAIRSGKIYYDNGAFRGKFNNAISTTLECMGAKFKNGAYYIERSLIPIEFAQAIGIVEAQTALKLAALSKYLLSLNTDDILLEKYIGSAVEGMFKKLSVDLYESAKNKEVPVISLGYVVPEIKIPKEKAKGIEKYWDEQELQAAKLHKDWKLAFDKVEHLKEKGVFEGIEYEKAVEDKNKKSDVLREFQAAKYHNAPKLSIDDVTLDKEAKKIAEDYVYNMQYWVKGWEVKNISKMREDVLKMTQGGARVKTIQEYFQKRWNIAKDKAHFLAVNESGLASSVIKATHYQNMGFTHFKWGRSSSKEKRHLHEEYYDKIFSYSDPPIIDERLGIKGLPRQIWNCRCHQIPIVNQDFYINARKINNDRKNIFKRIQNSFKRDNNAWRYRRFGQGETL